MIGWRNGTPTHCCGIPTPTRRGGMPGRNRRGRANLAAAQPQDVSSIGVQALSEDGQSTGDDIGGTEADNSTPAPSSGGLPAIAPITLRSFGALLQWPGYDQTSSQLANDGSNGTSGSFDSSDPFTINSVSTTSGLDGRNFSLFPAQSYTVPDQGDEPSDRSSQSDDARTVSASPTSPSSQSGGSPAPNSSVTERAVSPKANSSIQYGALRAGAPSDESLAELRRQQAAFSKVVHDIDLQNAWFAAPALAPPLVALGLEGIGALAGRAVVAESQIPHVFTKKDPYLRVGDNWATRAGRRAHAALDAKAEQKPGWAAQPRILRSGQSPLKPDAGGPQRNPLEPKKRIYLELKPNTPSGRAAAARAVKRYQDATKQKVRAIFYDPKDYM